VAGFLYSGIQIFTPDLFKSTTDFAAERAEYGLGRGLPGTDDAIPGSLSLPEYFCPPGALHLFCCAYQRPEDTDLRPLGGSVLLPILGGLDDLSFQYQPPLFPPALGWTFPRFIPMLTLYITISLGMSFYAFVKPVQRLPDSQPGAAGV
jgi:hypothetical protein